MLFLSVIMRAVTDQFSESIPLYGSLNLKLFLLPEVAQFIVNFFANVQGK